MSTERSSETGIASNSLKVVAICWIIVIFDGYDLVVYGAVLPSLLDYGAWNLSPQEAGTIGAYALVGMLIGALIAGTLTDVFGRRKIILLSVSWFSVAMGLCALAPTPELFGALRFVAGLGLGGVLPTAIALTIEYAPPRHRNLYNALMFSGYIVGGVLSSMLGIALISSFGWRIMFWIGAAPIAVIPLAYKYLPESIEFLYAKNREEEAREYARRFDIPPQTVTENAARAARQTSVEHSKLGMLTALFSRRYVVATFSFWFASFSGLLLIYGMYTWLPQIMREAGYALDSALVFLLLFNVGAVVGSVAVSASADRFGSKPLTVVAFLTAALAIFSLSFDNLPTAALYALAAIGGAGVIGAQMLVNAWVAAHYPASSRATALGWSLGLGRLGAVAGPIIGGLVIGSQLGLEWNFYVFAIFALLGLLVVLFVPRSPTRTAENSTTKVAEVRAGSSIR